ncbi:alpha/beta fold hydrolase, partial [bacterium]|nr:alpha/beta fold hydrolase [bacterium]
MRIACLSGWGQPHDALECVAPGATHIDYARHDSANAALLHIAAHARDHDVVIGWSLGGQLAVRAIAAGMLRTRALVLIAAPFQFVKNAQLPLGMPQDLFATFRANFARKPHATLNKAWELIAKDDSNDHHVRGQLATQDREAVLRGHWLAWLDLLEQYSAQGLLIENAPPTLLVHGEKDLVV